MKYIVSFVFLLTSAIALTADPSLSLGAGVNFSTISGSDSLVTKSDFRPGFNVKLGFEKDLSRYFSIETGVSLEKRGEINSIMKNLDPTSVTPTMQVFTEEINILNFQLPVMAKLNIPFSVFCFNVFAGPELGIFLSGEKYIEKIFVHVPAKDTNPAHIDTLLGDTTDFSRDMKMLEFGINAGIGFEIKTGDFGAFFVRSGIYLGLTDILDKNLEKEANDNLSGLHQSIYATVGYKFNIKTNNSRIEQRVKGAAEPTLNTTNHYFSSSNYESSGLESSNSDSESSTVTGSDTDDYSTNEQNDQD